MTEPGRLKDRVTFQRRALDDNGDRLGAWEDMFSRAAQLFYQTGSETVIEARLQGRQPVTITVRDETLMRDVTNGWRAVNTRNASQTFDLKTAPIPSKKMGDLYVDLQAEVSIGQNAS